MSSINSIMLLISNIDYFIQGWCYTGSYIPLPSAICQLNLSSILFSQPLYVLVLGEKKSISSDCLYRWRLNQSLVSRLIHIYNQILITYTVYNKLNTVTSFVIRGKLKMFKYYIYFKRVIDNKNARYISTILKVKTVCNFGIFATNMNSKHIICFTPVPRIWHLCSMVTEWVAQIASLVKGVAFSGVS